MKSLFWKTNNTRNDIDISSEHNDLELSIYDSKNNSTSSYDEDEHKECIVLLYKKIKSLLIIHKYHCVIDLITSQQDIFMLNKKVYFTLFDIKMKCIFKIISSNIEIFYYKTSKANYSPQSKIAIALEKQFECNQQYLNAILTYVKSYNKKPFSNNELFIKEVIIQNFCYNLYYLSSFCLIKSQFQDAIAYLSLARSLLEKYIHKCKQPHTLLLYLQILLKITSLLIDDKSYQHALKLNEHFSYVCIKYLHVIIKDEKGVHVNNIDKNDFVIKQAIQYLVCSLYQMGICCENIGNIVHAIEAYKQACFLSNKLLYNYNMKFNEIVKRTLNLCLQFKQSRDNEKEGNDKIHKSKQNEKLNRHLMKLSKIASGDISSLSRFNSLISYLESDLEIKEPKTISSLIKHDNNKHNNSKTNLSSTLLLYNDLLSTQYEHFVNETSNINMNYIDKTISNNLETYSDNLFYKINHSTPSNNNISNKQIPSFRQSFSKRDLKLSFQSPNTNSHKHLSFHLSTSSYPNVIYNYQHMKTNTNIQHTVNPKHHHKEKFILKTSPNILKFKNRGIFKKTKLFKNKVAYLETMHNKEIKFQKQLLAIKRNDNKITDEIYESQRTFDLLKVKKDSEEMYTRLKAVVNKENEMRIHKENNEIIDNELQMIQLKKYKLCESIIKGLNYRNVEEMNKLHRKEIQAKREIERKYITAMGFKNNNDKLKKMFHNANSHNKKIINILSKDIENAETKTKSIKKQINNSYYKGNNMNINSICKTETFSKSKSHQLFNTKLTKCSYNK